MWDDQKTAKLFDPTTDLPAVLVDQAIVPSTSLKIKPLIKFNRIVTVSIPDNLQEYNKCDHGSTIGLNNEYGKEISGTVSITEEAACKLWSKGAP